MKVIQSISRLQRSPENVFIPVHTQLRPRTRSSVTIWHLPEEILLHFLKGLQIKDLLNMRVVHPYFLQLIDSHTSIWTAVTFHNCWPSPANLHHFQRAQENGNLEASIKLAVAYLYSEGLPSSVNSELCPSNGNRAAELFCKTEALTPNTVPFTWLFIRPPWSVSGACCKEGVFQFMKKYLEKEVNRDISVCVGKMLQLLDGEGTEAAAVHYLQLAAQHGSPDAALALWEMQYSQRVLDKAAELESMRQLRDVASMGCLNARLYLGKYYASGKYGGISRSQVAAFLKEVFQTTSPTGTHRTFQNHRDLTPSMRYILVDWLVEVAGMKDFSTLTLHAAVNLVDRFLQVHAVPRSQLQLLGVAAMVICSRFLGKDIITIREAAWLTDSTYSYEDVVRMMGEITATVRGNIRVATSLDYVNILTVLAPGMDQCCTKLAEYICELSLLQAEMGQYSPAEIAASCVLLARILVKMETPWPSVMEEFTGFSVDDISRCAFHVHEKCFMEGSVVDHRDITLQAVKQRYSDEKYHCVSSIDIMSYEQLCSIMGVTEHVLHGTDVKLRFKNADELIVSPSRGKSRSHRTIKRSMEREKASTPTVEKWEFPESAMMSGYDGDHEDDDDESFMELNDSINSVMTCDSSDLTIDSDSDTYTACLSSFCNGESSLGGIKVKLLGASSSSSSSSPCLPFPTSCRCAQSSSTSGVSSSPSSQSSPSPQTKRTKCNFRSFSSYCMSHSEYDTKSPFEDSFTTRKSPRTATQMTSPNALKRKNRKRTSNTGGNSIS
ncbi:cyclin-F-like [Haliotis asinina]|uniref:cyclin-F-like n=1 Tax=Haliotis asinina TaxID=109174 RepID=UPI0035326BE8